MRNKPLWCLLAIGMSLLLLAPSCQRHTTLGLGLDTMYNGTHTARQPSVRIESTTLPPMKMVSVSFEFFTEEEIGKCLNVGYSQLFNYINEHRLSANRMMAFYYTYDMPFTMEAAIEVDSIPLLEDNKISARVVEGGRALIAHYKGPYEKATFAYQAIQKWLKDNHRVARELPFEVYLNNPSTVKNNNDLLTDIYQFMK